eukprot:CAMPEP_0172534330 /NCGR_PEP_ID=MMETSP1067-20121228/6730_1 /TAXON_ID=265564 ORGANISM="Thalassiosira punctigera, Strain Tpunct2005C2" /NCGR_SAMPLE_ID=MMETSP1067 /ASSEMBLY_ACC=CAM_ASM_000444 /LENGTH=241 /DNA_ID=CAMNT_0013319107 /DNA_START=404 /DNA_END=1129 /DNA_ORIENTATION=+
MSMRQTALLTPHGRIATDFFWRPNQTAPLWSVNCPIGTTMKSPSGVRFKVTQTKRIDEYTIVVHGLPFPNQEPNNEELDSMLSYQSDMKSIQQQGLFWPAPLKAQVDDTVSVEKLLFSHDRFSTLPSSSKPHPADQFGPTITVSTRMSIFDPVPNDHPEQDVSNTSNLSSAENPHPKTLTTDEYWDAIKCQRDIIDLHSFSNDLEVLNTWEEELRLVAEEEQKLNVTDTNHFPTVPKSMMQ